MSALAQEAKRNEKHHRRGGEGYCVVAEFCRLVHTLEFLVSGRSHAADAISANFDFLPLETLILWRCTSTRRFRAKVPCSSLIVYEEAKRAIDRLLKAREPELKKQALAEHDATTLVPDTHSRLAGAAKFASPIHLLPELFQHVQWLRSISNRWKCGPCSCCMQTDRRRRFRNGQSCKSAMHLRMTYVCEHSINQTSPQAC